MIAEDEIAKMDDVQLPGGKIAGPDLGLDIPDVPGMVPEESKE